jgi:hypothetical protein
MFCIKVTGSDSTEHPGIEAACVGCSLSLLEWKTEGADARLRHQVGSIIPSNAYVHYKTSAVT